ncbi:MAG: hypothetical protein ABL895_10320 [Cyclobacteriaceae bacterium]
MLQHTIRSVVTSGDGCYNTPSAVWLRLGMDATTHHPQCSYIWRWMLPHTIRSVVSSG